MLASVVARQDLSRSSPGWLRELILVDLGSPHTVTEPLEHSAAMVLEVPAKDLTPHALSRSRTELLIVPPSVQTLSRCYCHGTVVHVPHNSSL